MADTQHIVRKVISLQDPEYFCNRSWTLSFNMNTKTWISFHSYIPNFYLAENNFFYSGLNGCCDEFDFIAGTIIPATTTTTTTDAVCELDVNLIEATTTTTTTTTTINPYIYGDLYNWYVADYNGGSGAGSVAPTGWHVPTDNEWVSLFNSLGSTTVPMKSIGNLTDGTGLWTKAIDPSMEGTNASGFNINPSGVIRATGVPDSRNNYANFWGALQKSVSLGEYRNFAYSGNTMYTHPAYYDKHYGFNIRLVKDNDTGYPNIGDTGTVTDYDGNIYTTKKMPDGSVWMTQNLFVTHFNDGTPIEVDPADWSTRTTPARHTY